MSLNDRRGVPLSTTNRLSLERYERAVELLAGFYADPLAEIERALAEDPGFVSGHCLRAALFLISPEKGTAAELRRSVEAAEALLRHANARERGHIAAARAWLDGDFERAIELYGQVAIEYPRDLLAVQVAHQGDFLCGQQVMLRDRVARVLPAWDYDVPGYGNVLGMYAFGLEENNEFVRAEEVGRQALAVNARDPWAVHAVAHVMEMQGRQRDGISWLAERADDWSPDNMLAYHNWWHLALFHLDLDEFYRVFEIYDAHVWPKPQAIQMELVDATSMLWRLTLRDIAVGHRWDELADRWQGAVEDGHYAFNDMHAMMAMVGAGRDEPARRLLATLERCAAEGSSNGAMTALVGLPACRAIAAFGRGDWHQATELLLALRPHAQRFGGSNAQRDVLSLTLAEAALRAGDRPLARAVAAERYAAKPSSPFNRALMRRAGLGDSFCRHRISAAAS